MAGLCAEYRAGLPARLRELDELWAADERNPLPPLALRRALHSIAGSAQTFGLAPLTAAARAAEQMLDPCCEAGMPLPPASREDFAQLMQAVKSAANQAPPA